jgi:hypothetical protein
MVEKIVAEKPSIVLELKALNESQTKSECPMPLRNLNHRRILETSIKLIEIGNMSNPVIAECGGLRGAAEKITRKQYPGKEFEYVNMDFFMEGLKKSGGYRLLSDMTHAPLKDNSVDVVLIMNLCFGTDSLREKVEGCPAGTEGREELLQLLDCMTKLQSRIVYLEGVRILRKGGRLAWGGVADKEEFKHMNSSDDFTGTGNLTRLNGVYNEMGKGKYPLSYVYEKIDNKPCEKFLSEEREDLDSLFDELKNYEAEGGLLWKMRKEGIIRNLKE